MAPITKIPRSIKASAATLLWGVGNSNDFYAWSDANKNAVEFRFNSSAASGDSRGVYAQMKFSGAGGGEVVRAFAKASAANVATAGTVNGIHATLSIDTSSSVSGAGNAGRFTLGAAAASRTLGGTLASLQLDSDIGTGNTLPTAHGFLRVTNSGAVALSNLAVIPAASNGTMFAAHTTQNMTHSIRIIDATGTPYYIMCTNAATNRS